MINLRTFSQDKVNWIIAGLIFAWIIAMLILNRRNANISKAKRVKLYSVVLCEFPLLVCVIYTIFNCFRGRMMMTLLTYGGIYLSAVIAALLPLLFKLKRRRIVSSVVIIVTVIGCMFTIIYPAVTNCGTRNYSHSNFIDSFEAMTNNMKEYYTLLEWKDTNIDQIKADVLPMVKQAQESDDKALYVAAMCKYTYSFYDGHTWVNAGSKKIQEEAERILAGNDYGLSLLRLENGETIAMLVEDGCEAYKKGIENGTRIIKWNGIDIDEAINEVECIYTKEYGRWPVKDNENMFKPVFLAGKGDDEVQVTFYSQDSAEVTVSLSKLGSYRERLEKACEILLAKDKIQEYENYYTCMLNESFGYMRISAEEYSFLSDLIGYVTGQNSSVRDMFNEKIQELINQGMKKLIIDVRNNTGGYSVIPLELTSLFTKQDIFINNMAYIEDGKVEIVREDYVTADGRFADIEVIMLTNNRCVSSGDYLVYCMGECDNVKIVGLTFSNGSSQPVGGNCVMSDGICDIRYPQNWMLDAKGDRFIDTGKARENRIPFDEKIPLTYQGVMDMYNGIDYELEHILENY